ncbi:MAG: hypothetical protein FJY83_06790 [Candidatus Aminicenantes bacterium]|nr:hypothetical protein [Candidatus Aminicenantes bacterium]
MSKLGPRNTIRAIIGGEPAPRCGFWLGNPHAETWPILHGHFGTSTEEELRVKLGDDFRWISPQFFPSTYRHPAGRKLFDSLAKKERHGVDGPLAGCRTAAEVEAYDWPDPDYLHFDECLEALASAGDFYRASGFWTPFFHDVMDLFGMEPYLTKMYTQPEVVRAATDRVCGFYHEANERFFRQAGGLVDAFFFGNDFGTQADLILSPALFDEFILPWFRKFTAQGHGHGLQVILHSCGSIRRVIPRLIEAGVDCLHPLQARAAGMEAEDLARDFQGRLAFLGGVDTQDLLLRGTPGEVRDAVRRLKRLLGPRLIVSPSHEALLSNVPPQNVAAMAEAARG